MVKQARFGNVRILRQQTVEKRGARSGQPHHEERAPDLLIGDFRMPRAVIDQLQPMPDQLDQLTAREETAEGVELRVALEGFEQLPQPGQEGVGAKIVELRLAPSEAQQTVFVEAQTTPPDAAHAAAQGVGDPQR